MALCRALTIGIEKPCVSGSSHRLPEPAHLLGMLFPKEPQSPGGRQASCGRIASRDPIFQMGWPARPAEEGGPLTLATLTIK